MKKSTQKLILNTILGIIASFIFYSLSKQQNPFIIPRIREMINIGIFVCPFIGLLYWIFFKELDDWFICQSHCSFFPIRVLKYRKFAISNYSKSNFSCTKLHQFCILLHSIVGLTLVNQTLFFFGRLKSTLVSWICKK